MTPLPGDEGDQPDTVVDYPVLDHYAYIDRLEHLTPRVGRVVELMAQGWHVADIAFELSITQNTVHNHLKSGLKRVGLRGGRDAMVAWLIWGIRHGDVVQPR